MSRASYRNRKKLKKKLREAGAGPEEFRRQCRAIRQEIDGPCMGSLQDILDSGVQFGLTEVEKPSD